jgi:hypothetical protein
MLLAGLLPTYAAPQSGNLVQHLQSTYVPNVMDASGIKVAQPGSILVVQVEGIQANPRGRLSAAFANAYVDGQIQVNKRKTLGIGVPSSLSTARSLAVGEKLYLLKTEVKDSDIVFLVQSCGTCNPKAVDPAHQPFRAEVSFKFIKGALAATDFKSVQSVIEQVFKFPDSNTDTAAAGGAAPTEPAAPAQAPAQPNPPPPPPPSEPEATPKFADIPPPPPPPAAPRKISLGQSLDEVKTNFGEPVDIYELGDKVIYKYKNIKVTFLKGKVTDVE